MRIGIDFDNTIACYDLVFHRVALERGLIPAEVSVAKDEVRDYLRGCDKEDAWTKLQGYVYGVCIQNVSPFPGVLEFLARCKQQGSAIYIISHKTRYPLLGPRYDLHQAAYEWLANHNFCDPARTGLTPRQLYFELTKQGKLERVAQVGCTHFIDDLPEFLAEPDFPTNVERILFDPNNQHTTGQSFQRAISWQEIETITFGKISPP